MINLISDIKCEESFTEGIQIDFAPIHWSNEHKVLVKTKAMETSSLSGIWAPFEDKMLRKPK